jgi:hypothetical protein
VEDFGFYDILLSELGFPSVHVKFKIRKEAVFMPKTQESPKKLESTGLVIITRMPDKRFGVVLRQRGKIDYKGWIDMPWAGAYQVSAHGKLRWGETHRQTIERKIKEQLGEGFLNRIDLDNRDPRILVDDKRAKVKTYALCVMPECVSTIRQEVSCDGVIVFPLEERGRIRKLTKQDRDKPITDPNEIAMFRDEIRALNEIIRRRQEILAFFNRR